MLSISSMMLLNEAGGLGGTVLIQESNYAFARPTLKKLSS
jgi:hypothetical protein